jgi:CRP-like cAMP-binding protein
VSTPPPKDSVVKIALKRADIGALVSADEALRTSGFVKALGRLSDSVLKQGTARRYPDRTVLFQQGDSGNSLFFVLRGEVRMSGRKGTDVVELGSAVLGDVFGEVEVLSGEASRNSSAVAQGEVDVAEFPRASFLQQGRVVREVLMFLQPIQQSRQKALHEMTDFLNRW